MGVMMRTQVDGVIIIKVMSSVPMNMKNMMTMMMNMLIMMAMRIVVGELMSILSLMI